MSQQNNTIQVKKNVPFELEYNPKFLPAGFQFISKRVDNKWRIIPHQDGVVPSKMPTHTTNGKASPPINVLPAKATIQQPKDTPSQNNPVVVNGPIQTPVAAHPKAQKNNAVPTPMPSTPLLSQSVLDAQRRKEELLKELARLEQIVGK